MKYHQYYNVRESEPGLWMGSNYSNGDSGAALGHAGQMDTLHTVQPRYFTAQKTDLEA